MRLGIDFGSRWIVAAIADRGNYPVISFEGEQAGSRQYFPALVAVQGTKRIYGWDAWSAQSDPSSSVFGATGAALPVGHGGEASAGASKLDLLFEIALALHTALDVAHLNRAASERYEVMLGIPVQAEHSQRSATVEAFLRAGFVVLGIMEEPLADSLEYRHLHEPSGSILVCHLGASLSAASIVEIHEIGPVTIASAALEHVSADYFDTALAELAWKAAGLPASAFASISPGELFSLNEECRRVREARLPSAQRFVIDLSNVVPGGKLVSVSMEAIQERWQPQLDRTIEALERLLAAYKGAIAAIYATGEGSELPFVVHRLKETFGEQVCRAANGRATTAIGLAIAAEHINEDEQYEQSYLRPHDIHAVAPFPIPNLDPEHWLAKFIQHATKQYDASGGTITLEAVSELLQQHQRAFSEDLETARRMVRTYPQLFKKT